MELDLGPCCSCFGVIDVRNILCLEKRAPVPGTGWGCVVCNLPLDGALAVVCDACLEAESPIVCAVHGLPVEKGRCALSALTEPFAHDMSKHQGEGGE